MKLNTLAPLMLSGALLAPAAQGAKLKTGLEFQFDLALTSKENDKDVEGDKTIYGFSQRRARWWLSGNFEEHFDYKFRYDFKSGGAVGLSYVRVGNEIAKGTKVYVGRGYDPIPMISVVADSYRMSDQVVSSSAAKDLIVGDIGVQLVSDVGVGEVKVGFANGEAVTAVNHTSKLSNLAFGAAFAGSFGMFSPYVGFALQDTGSEKIKADNTEWSGRTDMDISVGAGIDLGATDLFLNFASVDRGEVTRKDAAGNEVGTKEVKTSKQGIEFKASQAFSDKFEGALYIGQDTNSSDGTETGTAQNIALQAFMYPHGNDNIYFTGSIASSTAKPKNGKSSTTNKFILTFSARPSYVIGD